MIRLVYPTDPNFGDAMSPLIVEKLSGQKVVSSGMWNADMMAVGSVFYRGDYFIADTYHARPLRRIKAAIWDFCRILSRPIQVWGSGFLQYPPFKQPHFLRKIKVSALRGIYTRRILEGLGLMTPDEKVIYGDPGLLFTKLFSIKKNTQYDIGIIPHVVDQEWGCKLKTAFLKTGINAHLIDVKQAPINVVSEISKCERILSSSLHGLIVADSLSIPNKHMELSTLGHSRKDFELKFIDYYSAFDEKIHDSISGEDILNYPMRIIHNQKFTSVNYEKIKMVQDTLLETFPLKLNMK